MKVLVIGKGGREHALAWKLGQSAQTTRIYCAPGNAGTAREAENVDIEPHELDRLLRFARKENIGLTVVGPEDPLAAGVVDQFEKAGLRVFGPTKAAAQLEASKVFAKDLMRQFDIPTAEFRVFDHPEPARRFVETRDYPLVIKADGLAAGKGVVVCSTTDEALAAVDLIMVKEAFGQAGRRIVVEKRLEGRECSVLAFVSGRTILTLPVTLDHKKALDGDQGPNTGGMGTVCPAEHVSADELNIIESQILVPVVHALKRTRRPFKGVLFAGVMLTPQGPRVLEFNVRFGDPETQPLLMRLQTDLLALMNAVVTEELGPFASEGLLWDPRAAVCVVLASQGYPGSYSKGKLINGLDEAAQVPGVKVFHAGTALESDRVVTDGGRVVGVTALGETIADARRQAYAAVDLISFQGKTYRTDIGAKVPTTVGSSAP